MKQLVCAFCWMRAWPKSDHLTPTAGLALLTPSPLLVLGAGLASDQPPGDIFNRQDRTSQTHTLQQHIAPKQQVNTKSRPVGPNEELVRKLGAPVNCSGSGPVAISVSASETKLHPASINLIWVRCCRWTVCSVQLWSFYCLIGFVHGECPVGWSRLILLSAV